MKKLGIFLATIVMLMLFVVSASAEEGKNGYYTYSVDNGYAYIIDVDKSISGDIILPETLGGAPVIGIDDEAFMDCTGITSVVVPTSFSGIGESAFKGCTNLVSVDMYNVQHIDRYAFANCISLVNVEIPKSTEHIYWAAFSGCLSLKSVVLPEALVEIDTYVFQYCESLEVIYVGKNVNKINLNALEGCTGLKKIIVDDENERYSSDDNGVLFDKYKISLIYYPINNESKIYKIPDEVVYIDSCSFFYCENLEEVIIPDSVKYIGERAFNWSKKLRKATIGNVSYIDTDAFRCCENLSDITMGNKGVYICVGAFHDTAYSNNINNYEAGALYIGKHLIDFDYDTGWTIESYTIKEGTLSIAESALQFCRKLKNITIPDTVTHIGSTAFAGTAFYWDENNWENGALYLDKYLLNTNEKLFGEYEVKAGTTVIAGGAFSESGVTNVIIPDSVKIINAGAFEDSPSLVNIEIPNSVKFIESKTFLGCSSLDNIVIPESVIEIGECAFGGCESLTNIKLSDNITYIGWGAFESCESLKNIKLPKALNIIHKYVFRNCYNLTDITMYNNVSMILMDAFSRCWCLDNIYYYGTEDDWNNIYIWEIMYDGVIYYLGAPHKHTVETFIVYPTCSVKGVMYDKCADVECGEILSEIALLPIVDHIDNNGDYICDFNCGYEFEKPVPEVPDEPIISDQPEKELNFFEKIIEWFKNLFDKLFGWLW